ACSHPDISLVSNDFGILHVSSLSRNSIWQKIKPLTPTHTIYGEITYDETMKNYNIFMTEVEFYSMIGILLM
ncbi:MAG TPA: hypothetical protein PKV93_13505, partial [Fervidobacterium sp.]|nr:hypothetical protein [Fervidobacterium sp.]